MVPFAGWHMPIQYAKGVVQEHLAVRNSLGLFDVSHMGEIDISGEDAGKCVQYIITNDIQKMSDHSVLYSLMCYEHGGVVDDLLVYRFSENHYFLCVNASNIDKDFQWIRENAETFNVQVRNVSDATAQLAIQGPQAEPFLQKLSDVSLKDLKYYHFKTGNIQGVESIISRTGYTGEDGFEIYFDASHAECIYEQLMESGKDIPLEPIGLGARDTLRMEMGYPLYGNEISSEGSPLEAGLGWVIKLNKDNFVGKRALEKQKAKGLSRKLVGIKCLERGVPRFHYALMKNGKTVGELTSGTHSPTLKTGIGLGYLTKEIAEPGTSVQVEVRNQLYPAEVAQLPLTPSHVKK